MKTRRLFQIVTLLLVALIPAMAMAHPSDAYQPSAFQRAIAGSPLDPHQTSLWIEPPRGGAVMVYENGDLKGWFLKPGAVAVQPNHVYGILATRGTSVVFHSGLLVRAGVTQVSFRGSESRPAVAFQPAYLGYGHTHAHAQQPARPRPATARPRPAGATHATPRVAKATPKPAMRSARKVVAVAPRTTAPSSKASAPSRRSMVARLSRRAPLRAMVHRAR